MATGDLLQNKDHRRTINLIFILKILLNTEGFFFRVFCLVVKNVLK